MNDIIEMPSVVPSSPMKRVQSQYSTAVAVQVSRQVGIVRERVQNEAELAGDSFFYGWSAGGSRIEGPSIKCAMSLARCWGNCAVDLQPVQDTPQAWIFSASFVDLETGFTVSRQFRQSKGSMVYGDLDLERKDDIRFQIGQSKAIRNVVLNALPSGLIDMAMEVAKQGGRKKLESYIANNGMAAARSYVINALKSYGVEEERAIHKVGAKSANSLTIDDLLILKADIQALQDGAETAETLYGKSSVDGGGSPSNLSDLTKKLKAPKQEPSVPDPKPGIRMEILQLIDDAQMGDDVCSQVAGEFAIKGLTPRSLGRIASEKTLRGILDRVIGESGSKEEIDHGQEGEEIDEGPEGRD